MGKAQIITGLGKGLYQARIMHDLDQINAAIQSIENRLASIGEDIARVSAQRVETEQEAAAKKSELDNYIALLSATSDPAETKRLSDIISKNLVEYFQIKRRADGLLAEETSFKAIQESLLLKKSRLQALAEQEDIREIWCADYSDGLSGEVITCELNGEPVEIVIFPHGGGIPLPEPTSVRMITPIAGQSAAQAAFNFAVYPGWQRWFPTYRQAYITQINYLNNTCSLQFPPTMSYYQDLPINMLQSVDGVPVKYMRCHAAPFDVGDSVLVRFVDNDPNRPEVIGFISNPKKCGFIIKIRVISDKTGNDITENMYFAVYDENRQHLSAAVTYDGDEGYWVIDIEDPAETDRVWFRFRAPEHSIDCQYSPDADKKRVYLENDLWLEKDMILSDPADPVAVVDTVYAPWWEITADYYFDPPLSYDRDVTVNSCYIDDGWRWATEPTGLDNPPGGLGAPCPDASRKYSFHTGLISSYQIKRGLKTSIPYRIRVTIKPFVAWLLKLAEEPACGSGYEYVLTDGDYEIRMSHQAGGAGNDYIIRVANNAWEFEVDGEAYSDVTQIPDILLESGFIPVSGYTEDIGQLPGLSINFASISSDDPEWAGDGLIQYSFETCDIYDITYDYK